MDPRGGRDEIPGLLKASPLRLQPADEGQNVRLACSADCRVGEKSLQPRGRLGDGHRPVVEGRGKLSDTRGGRPAGVAVVHEGALRRLGPIGVTAADAAVDESSRQPGSAKRAVIADGFEQRDRLAS